MKVTRTSIVSGDTHQFEFDITPDQWIAYSSGELKIQDAFPHLKTWEREFIMSGITEDEWNELFAEDDHEELPHGNEHWNDEKAKRPTPEDYMHISSDLKAQLDEVSKNRYFTPDENTKKV